MEENQQTEKLVQSSEHQTPSEASTFTTNKTNADVVSTGGANNDRSLLPAEGEGSPAQESDATSTGGPSVLNHQCCK